MTENEQNSACSGDNSYIFYKRIHRLFHAIDGDGDGYIDSKDLVLICRELSNEDFVEDLIKDLVVVGDGRVSFSEFLRQRIISTNSVEALHNLLPRDYPASSNNSLGAPSGSKNDSRWEFDSGARDLSPEPHMLQKLMEVATGTSSTNSTNLLQLASKLHLAALASLRSEILDLSTRLRSVTEERDLLEKSLARSQCVIDASVVQHYEDRLDNLQSIIANLNFKLEDNKSKSLVIPDEDDDCTISVESEKHIECYNDLHDFQRDNALPDFNHSSDVACTADSLLYRNKNEGMKTYSLERLTNHQKVEELSQNIINLQAENAKLQTKLNLKDIEIKKLRSSFVVGKANQHCKNKESHFRSNTEGEGLGERVTVTPMHLNPPIPKIAERVRIQRMNRQVTGSDIASLGVSHTEVAEHLVSSVLEQCDFLEMGNDYQKFEIETERLVSRLEHTRAFNTLLQSSLEEVKSHCERLTLLLGKYENNAIALQLVLGCCDRIITAYEELVEILSNRGNENCKKDETQLKQLIGNLKKERSTIEGTVVQLESYVESPPPSQPQIPNQARKLDLETAVLIQEIMSMREEKSDLNATIYRLEKEKECLVLKLATMETQQQTQLATVQHLKLLHEPVPEHQEKYAETQKEKILQNQLKEMAATVERISQNAEMRQSQHADMMVELRTTNCSLQKTIEKNKHKYESRLHKLEAQMLTTVSRHAAQVQVLKQRILQLLDSKTSISCCDCKNISKI